VADDVTLPGTGVVIVTEDIGGGVELPVSKIHTGAHGTDGGAVTAANPLYVSNVAVPQYGSKTAMTCTLAALASGSAQGATAVQNTAAYTDVMIVLSVTLPSSGVSATGSVNVYAMLSLDGTTYLSGFNGTNGAVTLSAPTGLSLIGWLPANAVSTTFSGAWSFCVGGGFRSLPQWWSVVIQNNTGAAITSGSVNYQGLNG
jgi:hypothetical protein